MAKVKSGAQQGKDAAAKPAAKPAAPAALAAGKPPAPPSKAAPPGQTEPPAPKAAPTSQFAPLIAAVRAAAEHPQTMGHLHAADLKRWELLYDAALALAAAVERET